jgi:diguanylate cyclase (GGDEF)-like protein
MMALPFGGSAFWMCLPGALLAGAVAPTVPGGALGAAAVVGSSVGALAWRGAPPSSPVVDVLIAVVCAGILLHARDRLERERDHLRDAALTDALTGVANRRLLLSRAEYEIVRHIREQRPFAVVMIDLDGFKGLNDRFGHAAGDEILRDVAGSVKLALRAQDTLARLGGDEFCVLAPLTDRAGATRLAGRVARAIEEATTGVETVRASLGVAVFPHDGRSIPALLHEADERLLAAKRGRRERRARAAA